MEALSDAWQNLDEALVWCGWRIARDLQERVARTDVSGGVSSRTERGQRACVSAQAEDTRPVSSTVNKSIQSACWTAGDTRWAAVRTEVGTTTA